MYIYSEHITPRLQYIVNTLFAGTGITFTSSSVEFHQYSGAKINYSKKRFSDEEFLVIPSGLLFQQNIVKQNISCAEWNETKIFFQSNGDIPFDIFSASFYLLSRYEEYLPHKKDSYGRFAHEASLAFKENHLHLPLVNMWQQQLVEMLQEKFGDVPIPKKEFSFQPTYDIDIAYAWKGKGLLHKVASKLKHQTTNVHGNDVFDVYDWLDELHEQYQLSPIYFFLLAQWRSKYDKNLSPKSKELKQLIQRTAAKYQTGIHPSWQSYHDDTALLKEIRALSAITQRITTVSRQHYIQITLPYTYRKLIEAGIKDDHSMGYGSINGFRASFANSFYWYDLMKEKQTQLLLHPFCYMEANSFFEQKLSAEEAANELQHYYDVVKQVNGNLITIFHNHFLTEQEQWMPWRKMYEGFLSRNFSRQSITSRVLQEQL